MALTRPRAYQIYDIDYKQAVRVITLTNITLAGGAPNAVDSVNLSLNDRVLVAGQGNGAQNGIYYVTTVGSGSNGTWTRSIDTDTTGELLAGTIVMVTEGTVYHDSQWKLTTNDPIVIGTTPLVFEQNSAFAFGNVYANGTAVLATSVGDVLTLTPGNNISITGNNTSKTVTIGVTGISLNSISNGTSNVNVVSSGGNVTVGIGGTSNIAVFSSTGANITGTLGVSGNVTGGNLNTSGIVSATGNINTSGAVNINSTDGNYNVLNISGTALGPYGTPQTWKFFTNNVALGGAPSFIAFPDSSTQTTAYPGTTSELSLSGNITGGNLISNAAVIATGDVTGSNLITDGTVFAPAIVANSSTYDTRIELGSGSGVIAVTSDGNSTQFKPNGQVELGGVSQLVGGTFAGSGITLGLSQTDIFQTRDGNVTVQVGTGGTTTSTWTFANNGNLLAPGNISATGDISGVNILGNGRNLTGINTFSSLTVTGSDTITAANIASSLTFTGDTSIVVTANASTNTVSFAFGGAGDSIFSTGGTMGLVDEAPLAEEDLGLITDTVTEAYDLGGFYIDGFVGNDNFIVNTINGNILAANAVITTTGNITAGNLIATANLVSVGAAVSGNVTGGNLLTAGQVVSTGAVYSNYNTNTANIGSFMATGGNTKGGTGYLDFLVAQNTSGGATNPYKWFRVNSTGGLEIINSAYTSTVFSLTDSGNVNVSGQYQVSGKQAVNGPAFRAYIAVNQAITSGSQQKVTFGSETFDTNNNFASSRFTPTVEGYYQLNATVRLGGVSGTGEGMITIWKNGSEYARGHNESGTEQGASFYSMQVSDLAYANGSTDYFEIYIQQGSGSNKDTTAGQNISYFSGAMVRGA